MAAGRLYDMTKGAAVTLFILTSRTADSPLMATSPLSAAPEPSGPRRLPAIYRQSREKLPWKC